MSTVRRAPARVVPPLENGQHLDQITFHERYEAMLPRTKAELVGGVVYMPSPMGLDHGAYDTIVIGWLERYVSFTPGVEGASAATVKLDWKGEPQPDSFLFILPGFGSKSRVDAGGHFVGAPDLVVEVSRSSRHFDLTEKAGGL